MNYANHNLRTNLQEWKNRISRADHNQFENQVKFLLANLVSSPQLNGLLKDAANKFLYTDVQLEEIIESLKNGGRRAFENETHQAAFCFQLLKYFTDKNQRYDLHNWQAFMGGSFESSKNNIIANYFIPILHYLNDRLDKSSSIIFLLEKYKRRTEWFTKKRLEELYRNADKNYEQIFEDDLRLFLFDQGIDYPFSTPKSVSGRGDIIGEIETDNPIIIEVKIFDRDKTYGTDRIKVGFKQILDYINDYNKDVGYLVIFNMDTVDLNLKFNNDSNIFPPTIKFNNKIFYFIVVNAASRVSASKAGAIEQFEITEDELTKDASATSG